MRHRFWKAGILYDVIAAGQWRQGGGEGGGELIGSAEINGRRERKMKRARGESSISGKCLSLPSHPLPLVPNLLRGGICPISPGLWLAFVRSGGRKRVGDGRRRKSEEEGDRKANSCCL